MTDFDQLMDAIASDQTFIRFNTHAHRLFVSTAYIQYAIRELPPSQSDKIALEIFNNQVDCLEHYHPGVARLFELGWDTNYDILEDLPVIEK